MPAAVAIVGAVAAVAGTVSSIASQSTANRVQRNAAADALREARRQQKEAIALEEKRLEEAKVQMEKDREVEVQRIAAVATQAKADAAPPVLSADTVSFVVPAALVAVGALALMSRK